MSFFPFFDSVRFNLEGDKESQLFLRSHCDGEFSGVDAGLINTIFNNVSRSSVVQIYQHFENIAANTVLVLLFSAFEP